MNLLSEVCYQWMIKRLISLRNYPEAENNFINDWYNNDL